MIHQTAYYGIYIQEEQGQFWVYETGNGADEEYDHYPTAEEVRDFRDRVTA